MPVNQILTSTGKKQPDRRLSFQQPTDHFAVLKVITRFKTPESFPDPWGMEDSDYGWHIGSCSSEDWLPDYDPAELLRSWDRVKLNYSHSAGLLRSWLTESIYSVGKESR